MSAKQKGSILAICGALMWGIQGPISQFLFHNQQISTEWLMGVKMTIAGAILMLFTCVKERPQALIAPWKNKRDACQLLLYALFGITLVQYMYFLTIEASDAGIATILQSLGTIIIILLTIVVYRKWPSKQEALAVIIAIIGTYLLVMKQGFHLSISPKALLFGMLLALAGALQTMLPVSLLKKYSSFVLLSWAMIIGGVIFTIIHPFWVDAPPLTPSVVLGVGFIVLFGTALSYICFTSSLQYISATSAGLLDAFEPASATLGAVLFLGTTFTSSQVIGGVLVLSTVLILAIPNQK